MSRPAAACDAVVLRTWPSGESSVVASLLTEDHGYVKVIAKSARRATSALRAAAQPGRLVNVEFGLEPRRDLQYLRAGALILDPLAVGATLERSAFLLAAMEIADRCRPAALADAAAFDLCRRFLLMLSSAAPGGEAAVFYRFELAWLDAHGLSPVLDACAGCGADLEERPGIWFSPAGGGVVCERCLGAGAGADGRAVTTEALAALRDLAAVPLDGPVAPLERGPGREIGVLLHRFLGYHLPGYRLPAALELLRAPAGAAPPPDRDAESRKDRHR